MDPVVSPESPVVFSGIPETPALPSQAVASRGRRRAGRRTSWWCWLVLLVCLLAGPGGQVVGDSQGPGDRSLPDSLYFSHFSSANLTDGPKSQGQSQVRLMNESGISDTDDLAPFRVQLPCLYWRGVHSDGSGPPRVQDIRDFGGLDGTVVSKECVPATGIPLGASFVSSIRYCAPISIRERPTFTEVFLPWNRPARCGEPESIPHERPKRPKSHRYGRFRGRKMFRQHDLYGQAFVRGIRLGASASAMFAAVYFAWYVLCCAYTLALRTHGGDLSGRVHQGAGVGLRSWHMEHIRIDPSWVLLFMGSISGWRRRRWLRSRPFWQPPPVSPVLPVPPVPDPGPPGGWIFGTTGWSRVASPAGVPGRPEPIPPDPPCVDFCVPTAESLPEVEISTGNVTADSGVHLGPSPAIRSNIPVVVTGQIEIPPGASARVPIALARPASARKFLTALVLLSPFLAPPLSAPEPYFDSASSGLFGSEPGCWFQTSSDLSEKWVYVSEPLTGPDAGSGYFCRSRNSSVAWLLSGFARLCSWWRLDGTM